MDTLFNSKFLIGLNSLIAILAACAPTIRITSNPEADASLSIYVATAPSLV
jgi:hypothetical protein